MPTPFRTAPIVQKSAPRRHEITDPRIQAKYFDDLAALIEHEPDDLIADHERFQLAAIGIEKGRPFAPDAARRQLLDDAARLASAIARANSFASDDEARLVYPDRRFYPDPTGAGNGPSSADVSSPAPSAQAQANSSRRR